MSALSVCFEGVEPIVFDQLTLVRSYEKLCADHDYALGPITIVFCSEPYMIEANNKFLSHNYPTDIITFDYSESTVVSGDLLVCPPVVLQNSADYSTSFTEELFRVCLHGVLHLVGYADKTEDEVLVMSSKEDHYLSEFVNPFI